MVRIVEGRRVRRVAVPKKDPCRVERRVESKGERRKREKSSFPNVKNTLHIPRVVSLWKNPLCELVPLEERCKSLRGAFVVHKPKEINVKQFTKLKDSLDFIETVCEGKKLNKDK